MATFKFITFVNGNNHLSADNFRPGTRNQYFSCEADTTMDAITKCVQYLSEHSYKGHSGKSILEHSAIYVADKRILNDYNRLAPEKKSALHKQYPKFLDFCTDELADRLYGLRVVTS